MHVLFLILPVLILLCLDTKDLSLFIYLFIYTIDVLFYICKNMSYRMVLLM